MLTISQSAKVHHKLLLTHFIDLSNYFTLILIQKLLIQLNNQALTIIASLQDFENQKIEEWGRDVELSSHAKLKLRDGEIRVASVRKLIERRQAEARLSADRREQKNTDEFASRAAWNRQHDSDRADVC